MIAYTYIDDAQRIDNIKAMAAVIDAFGGQPNYVRVNPRHRWIARWTTRTGKTLARKLWGAA